ncbi:MAG: RIP metalloprotease RseP [Pseudomonadota bacterium]
MTVLGYVFALILTISLLVAVHEFGHFIVARWCGIKVLRFSIGFGKPIWRYQRHRDDTEYCISALPLGGYVKMLDEREGNVSARDAGQSFNAQPVWQRIAVLLAGPAFNFLFAIAAYWLILVLGTMVTRPVVGEVAPGSPADVAGLQYGDVIASVGGRSIESWQGGLQVLVDELVDDARIPLTIDREGAASFDTVLVTDAETARLSEPGKLFEGLGFGVWSPRPIIGEVTPDTPAAFAGIQPGDRVLTVQGDAVTTWNQVVERIRAAGETPVQLSLERGEQIVDVSVTPRMVDTEAGRVARIGAANFVGPDSRPENLYAEKRLGVVEALPAAVVKTGELTMFTLEMFGRMITGSVSTKNISGPINIAEYAGFTLSRGFIDFLDFLALVSVSLGVLNLLPVPMLDGGQIVYQSVEGITGRPLSERLQMLGHQVGLFLLVGVMSLAFYNDIARVVERFLS